MAEARLSATRLRWIAQNSSLKDCVLNLSIAPPPCLYRRRALLSCLRLALESDIQTSFTEYLLNVPWVMQTCSVFLLLLYPKLLIWQLIIGDLIAFIFSLNVSVHCQRPPGVFVYCFWPCWVFAGARAFRGLLSSAVRGLLRQWPPLWDTGSKECWPQWWWRMASVVVVPALSSKASIVLVPRALSLAAPQQVGPSQTESRSPALASRPFATEPPGKPRISLLWCISL